MSKRRFQTMFQWFLFWFGLIHVHYYWLYNLRSRDITNFRYSVWQTSARLKKGLRSPSHWWPWIACRILAKSEYWFERYCRAKISAVFGIFHTHVIFKKNFCHSQKNFMGPKNHILKKKYGVKIFLANWNFLATKLNPFFCQKTGRCITFKTRHS